MELPPLDLTTGGDFIPIEDLPSESFEIPSELLGKFEATKVEPPVISQNENKFQPKQKKNNKKQQQNNKQQNNKKQQPNNKQNTNNNVTAQTETAQNTQNVQLLAVPQIKPPAPETVKETDSATQKEAMEAENTQQAKPTEKIYDFEDIIVGSGVLETMPDGYGFLRNSVAS